MKNSSELNVLADFSMSEDTLVVHPNDAFDLGMMKTSYPIYIYRGISIADFKEKKGERMSGKIFLNNDCRLGTVEMGKKGWERIGKPKRVQLYYEEPNLLIWIPPQHKEE